jgi:hypothetical protein
MAAVFSVRLHCGGSGDDNRYGGNSKVSVNLTQLYYSAAFLSSLSQA